MSWWPCKQDLNDKVDSIDVYITAPLGVDDCLVSEFDRYWLLEFFICVGGEPFMVSGHMFRGTGVH